MQEDDFDKFEEEINNQELSIERKRILEGEIADRELQQVIDDDDFFDEDVVKDGVYIPPLDTDSPKMRQVWGDKAAETNAEFEPNSVCIDGDFTVVDDQPLLIEHDKDTK